MIALLMAAQVAAAPPLIQPRVFRGEPLAASACKTAAIQTSDSASPALLYRPQDRARTQVSKLAKLPKANKEIAVNRMVEGCPAPVVVQFNVGP